MITTLIFIFLAALTLIPALMVVSVRNVFHSALWLVTSLVGVAGFYAMLAADFLFAVQLLVYVGGVMVLLLFVVLLSGKPSDWQTPQVNEKGWAAALLALFVLTAVVSTVVEWPFSQNLLATPKNSTGPLAHLLLGEMLLPFELISLVLVAALVGAVYFSVKKNDRA